MLQEILSQMMKRKIKQTRNKKQKNEKKQRQFQGQLNSN